MSADDDSPVFCDRCLRELTPGVGDFYVIRIDAVADPSPPVLEPSDLGRGDLADEMRELIRDMENMSAREAMDQVARGLTIHLCRRCYVVWIENPAGRR